MDTISSIVVGLMLFIVFLCFMGAVAFIAFGALKWLRTKKELSTVDVTDGLDAREMKIIADLILQKKRSDEETEVRAKAVEALKVK